MNGIILNFENELNSYFKIFLVQLSNKHKIDTILDEWETFSKNITTVDDNKITNQKDVVKPKSSPAVTNNFCEYVFIKGKIGDNKKLTELVL